MSKITDTRSVPDTESSHAALNRVLNLSIFFVGAGVFAAAGLALRQTPLFGSLQLTYFSVGLAVGIIGLLLWGLTR